MQKFAGGPPPSEQTSGPSSFPPETDSDIESVGQKEEEKADQHAACPPDLCLFMPGHSAAAADQEAGNSEDSEEIRRSAHKKVGFDHFLGFGVEFNEINLAASGMVFTIPFVA
ncbi:MAG: hypothetical protein ACI97B_001068 [Verrucomicrobiales bacterium]|jgi:hypothetical protein